MQVWIDDGKSEADCALPAHRHTIDDDRGAPQPWYWRDTFPYVYCPIARHQVQAMSRATAGACSTGCFFTLGLP